MKRIRKLGCIFIAFMLIVTACFQYGIGAKAADKTNTQVSQLSTFMNGSTGFLEFATSPSGWSTAESLTAPGSTWMECNFVSNVKIYQGDADTTGISLGETLLGEVYYNFFGRQTLALSIKSDIYSNMTKIVIPAGTVFPSYLATGGSTPFNGVAGDDVAADPSVGHYVTTEEICYEGTPCMTASSATDWAVQKKTTVDSVKFDLGNAGARRMVFNIAGDADNDALSNGCFIGAAVHNSYNTKDYVQIYVKGEAEPRTLAEIYKTSDGNMYWNLYEAGSMTFPILDYLADATIVEKVVIKKGCEFPAVSYTGATILMDGYPTISATTSTKTTYVVQEDLTFLLSESATAANGVFEFSDTSTTTETAVTGVQTGNSNNNVTFTLSTTDYAGLGTAKIGEKHLNYSYLDLIQVHCGSTVRSLREVYNGGEKYYNLHGGSNLLTICLGEAYDTATKIVIPAGTVFPSAAYTGSGAWNAASIPDNYMRNKGGFETTEDITYVKPEEHGAWTVEIPSETATPVDINNVHVRGGGTDFRLLLFLPESDYGDSVNVDQSKLAEYNVLEHVYLYDVDGTEYKLSDIQTGSAYYKCWGEANSIGFGIPANLPVITRVIIKAGCELPTLGYTNGGGSYRDCYVVENDTIFSINTMPTDNTFSVDWTREEVLPLEEVATDISNLHIRTGDETRLMFFLTVNDYGTTENNVAISAELLAKYNILDKVTLYTTTGKEYLLSDVYGDSALFNCWGDKGTFAVYLDAGLDTIEKVLIKKGAQMPSMAFTKGAADSQLAYVLQEDILMVADSTPPDNNGTTAWHKEEQETVVATEVKNIHVRNGKLLVFLTNHDYASAGSMVGVTNFGKYNFADYIELHKTDGTSAMLADIISSENPYYNVWGETGSFTANLVSGWDGTNINKVVFKAGCEFPSYDYTNGTKETNNVYTLQKNITYITTNLVQENISWTQEQKLETVTEETEVLSAHLLGAKNDVRVILTLKTNDYADIGDSVAVSEKHKNYTTMQHIYLGKDGVMIPLSQIVSEEVYYNLWGYEGSISYGLQSQYSWDSFDEVVIEAGCDFPSYVYTSSTNGVDKKQYVTTSSKSIEIKPVTHKVTYYDENKNVLYEDDIISGSVFSMRAVPQKEGFLGKWEGLKYDVMPAQDISYQLVYIDDAVSAQKEPDVLQKEETKDVTESPSTGDAFEAAVPTLFVLLLASAAILLVGWMKSYIGGRHGRE